MKQRSRVFRLAAMGAFVITAALSLSCNSGNSDRAGKGNGTKDTTVNLLNKAGFQGMLDGVKTDLYVLKNASGMIATFTNYGGRLVSLQVPDKEGKLVNVVCGFSSIADYARATEPYYGATIGRFGNRIARGKFTLNGKTYTLFTNNGVNTLHGGKKGFQYQTFDASQPDSSTIVFTRVSKDMEEGFPGNLQVKVTYHLNADNGLEMTYDASTDKPTIINLTNHAFFNLNGEGNGTILNHSFTIYASHITPVDSTLIPMGKISSVKGTPFDFLTARTMGARIDQDNVQLKNGKGYDINYVLDSTGSHHLAATVIGDKSGIRMDVYTDQPGLQVYSGNFMNAANTFNNGVKDSFRTAFAMETQHFPDAPNHPDFPSTVLNPGQTYHTASEYKFSIQK
ncbi:aldose epimerase family protein [Arachidicoccus terrestris]|uniref:aldose epimerase family protein n=1 Tax=Arachidicoccus terrestris TaxID=2875539 RepID=UPI001CC333B5|nr:aldose epimerase family protein [Arachidicoccus terrestris]UAY57143.1 galactose mutarotase [Arachidicoccus terrestris]